MIYNVKHLFICIFSSIYDFDEVSAKIFGLFFNWVVWFLLLIFKSSLFIFNKSKQMCLLQVFSSNSLYVVFFRGQAFNFNGVQLINYFFHGSVLCLKRQHHSQSHLGPLIL